MTTLVAEKIAPEVTTLNVTVKALRVGSKQMTQAVFKQIIEECPFEGYEVTPLSNSSLWGWVNHHTHCKNDYKKHYHVIWQKADELRTYRFTASWLRPTINDLSKDIDETVAIGILIDCIAEADKVKLNKGVIDTPHWRMGERALNGLLDEGTYCSHDKDLVYAIRLNEPKRIAKIAKQKLKHKTATYDFSTYEEVHEQFLVEQNNLARLTKNQKDVWKFVSQNLPQLYIAV